MPTTSPQPAAGKASQSRYPRAAATGPDPAAGVVLLDTSTLVDDPDAISAFAGRTVVVPLTVIEELDGLKQRDDAVGAAARTALSGIEELRAASGTSLAVGAPTPCGGLLRVETNGVHRERVGAFGLDPARPDNRILAAALTLSDAGPVTVVTSDAALRIKAAQLGLEAAEYVPVGAGAAQDPGWVELDVPGELIDALYGDRRLPVQDLAEWLPAGEGVTGLHANRGVVLRGASQSALGRVKGGTVIPLPTNRTAWGQTPHSVPQRLALDLLLDPDVAVVALSGRAGTGKTFLALAAALEQTLEQPTFSRIGVYRPVVPVSRDSELGFLKGGLEEKLAPWMAAITDNFAALTKGFEQPPNRGRDGRGRPRSARGEGGPRFAPGVPDLFEDMVERGQLELGSIAHVRGRSLSDSFLVIDEAQSLSRKVALALLTRVGDGSKVVLTGDPDQIDAAYLSRRNNALAAVIDAFRGQDCFGHVTLTRQERSTVAELAARLLT